MQKNVDAARKYIDTKYKIMISSFIWVLKKNQFCRQNQSMQMDAIISAFNVYDLHNSFGSTEIVPKSLLLFDKF